jgi:hypothetical protein
MTKDVCSSLALVGCSYSTAICQLKDKLAIQSVLKVNKQLYFFKNKQILVAMEMCSAFWVKSKPLWLIDTVD